MTSSDAALMNICTIIFQDGEELREGSYLWRFPKIVANMRCRARSTHGIRQVYHHRNAILSISSFEGAGDARSLLLTAGPHYYANNTSSSRNDLFVRVFMTKYIK